MEGGGIDATVLWHVDQFVISESVVSSMTITVGLGLLSWIFSRRLQVHPARWQVMLEAAVAALESAVEQVAGTYTRRVMPFIASLWVFLVIANLVGLVPGLESPTRDLSTTSALAVMVFLSVHWFGISTQGLRSYLRHYLSPSPIMLPFHIISEISRTVALAVRLFGNMMSLEMAALLVLLVAGFLVPVPILMLHVVEALVQAYIFGMLALIYVASALQSQESQAKE